MYKLSIIIPHYRDINNLKRLVETIPVNKEIQIIIVDNTPGLSLSELDHLKSLNKNLQLYKSTISGAGEARNVGIRKAKGDWILFADSDDIFLSDFFEIVKEYFNSNYDVVYFSPKFQSNKVKKKDYRKEYSVFINRYINDKSEKNKWNIRLNFDVPWSKLIRLSFINSYNIRFDNSRKQNDTIFSQKIGIFSKNISVSQKEIYCAIDNSDSITNNIDKKSFEAAVNVRIKSYVLKTNNISRSILTNCDQKIFQEPIMTVISSLKKYKNIRYSYKIYREFKKNDIPVMSFLGLKNAVKYYKCDA